MEKTWQVLMRQTMSNLIPDKSNISHKSSVSPVAISAEVLRPLLNSERIELKFGNFGVELLKNEEKIRVSSLYSETEEIRTTRTFAVVSYPEIIDPLFLEEHKKIVSGHSIGTVFKSAGWNIKKQHTFFGEIDKSSNLSRVYRLMGNIDPTKLSTHIYELFISKNEVDFLYATISELHHPTYLSLRELGEIYENEFERYQDKNGYIQTILDKIIKEAKSIPKKY